MDSAAAAQQAEQVEVAIRPQVSGDANFIFGTWLNHMKGSSAYGTALQRDVFFKSHHRIVESILRRPTCRTLVAHPVGESDLIAGYLVTDQIRDVPVVHFGFVKGLFRGHGVMRRLWEASGLDGNECVLSHPAHAEKWLKQRFPRLEVLEFWR